MKRSIVFAALLAAASGAQAQILIAPPGGGSRICHQFGTVMVCN